MALLHALSRTGKRMRFEVMACGVDHGLRAEAREELQSARAFAGTLDVTFVTAAVSVPPGGNLQERARAARREALRAIANREGCAFIATGHHADDRAETVLLRLLRGAGPRGLAVLPPRDGDWIRPMIRARRPDIVQHLTRHAIAYAEDPSNGDLRFARVRVRREVMPLLESISPGIVDHLNALADQLSEGPPPRVEDAEGRPIPLGRAQVAQVQRALAKRQEGQVLLKGGKVLLIRGKTGAFMVQTADASSPSASGGRVGPPSPGPDTGSPSEETARNHWQIWRTSRRAKRNKSG
jgi:tRNA(Ile)-lysidine synthase